MVQSTTNSGPNSVFDRHIIVDENNYKLLIDFHIFVATIPSKIKTFVRNFTHVLILNSEFFSSPKFQFQKSHSNSKNPKMCFFTENPINNSKNQKFRIRYKFRAASHQSCHAGFVIWVQIVKIESVRRKRSQHQNLRSRVFESFPRENVVVCQSRSRPAECSQSEDIPAGRLVSLIEFVVDWIVITSFWQFTTIIISTITKKIF